MNPPQKGGNMSEYMYLFRRGEIPEAQRSPEQMQAHLQKWRDWIQALSQQGTFLAGQPLQNEGQVVAGRAKVITDGPFAEGKEMVGGYLIVRASDLPEAVEKSKGCPIFEYGGSVEVRAIQPFQL
jgi:hypothetical protein